MISFAEYYKNRNFTYASGSEAFSMFLKDQLNTVQGSRPYYPDYGCFLAQYKYTLLNQSTCAKIHSDVYIILSQMDGVRVISSDYKILINEKTLELYFDIEYQQEPIGLHLSYKNGGFV